jgi:hypothetical protein
MKLWVRCFGCILLLAALCADSVGAEPLAVLPVDIVLTGPNARQSLIVERVEDAKYVGEAGGAQEWAISDPAVAKVEDGVLLPLKNGEATVTVKVGDRSATAKVRVEKFDEADSVSFRNHVQSVLSKAGCNSGACHGAAAGKNGF